jgi:hypothetical protein
MIRKVPFLDKTKVDFIIKTRRSQPTELVNVKIEVTSIGIL